MRRCSVLRAGVTIACAIAVASAASAQSPPDSVLRDRTGRPEATVGLDSTEVQRLLDEPRPSAVPKEKPRVQRFGFTGGGEDFGIWAGALSLPGYATYLEYHPVELVGAGDLLLSLIALVPDGAHEKNPWPLGSRIAYMLGMAGLGLYQLEHGDEYSDNARLGINFAGVFATVLVTDLLFVKREP